jgi:hypothetical protein
MVEGLWLRILGLRGFGPGFRVYGVGIRVKGIGKIV